MSAEPVPVGRLVKGPSALGSDWRRFLQLTRTLAVTEWKLRFFDSVLGYLWQVMRPLLLFGMLLVVFTQFVRLGNATQHYAVMLLTGIVLYVFLSEATSRAVGCVVERENLVRKIEFPRLVIPLSVVGTSLFNLALNLVVVLIFAIASGVPLTPVWLLLPLLLLPLILLVTGLSMLLAALFVRFRDVRPIWDVALQGIFYGSPVLYPIDLIPDPTLQKLLMFNPFAAIVTQARHMLIDPSAPSAAEVAGGAVWLLVPVAVVIAILVLGYRVFDREAPHIAEDL